MVLGETNQQDSSVTIMKNQQMNLNQLLDVMGPELTDTSGKSELEAKVSVKLEEKELWSKFKEYTNEMIVTKNGR